MQEIIPGLFLGSFSSASISNEHLLEETGITHIVCVRNELEARFIQPNFPEKFKYTIINIADASTTNIIPFLPQFKSLIDNCLKIGGKVLVHGNAGVSRSASLVIGYIMETKGLAYNAKRVCVCPNEGFKQQLKEYEPIYKANRTLLNGHTSKATGKLKRRYDEMNDPKPFGNSMDI